MVTAIALSFFLAAAGVHASPLTSSILERGNGYGLGDTSQTNCLELDSLGSNTGYTLDAFGHSNCGNGDKGGKPPSTLGAPKKEKGGSSNIDNYLLGSSVVTCYDLQTLGFDTGVYFDYFGKSFCPPGHGGDKSKDDKSKPSNVSRQDMEALGIDTSKHPEWNCSKDTRKRTAYRPEEGSDMKKPAPDHDLKNYPSFITYYDLKTLGLDNAYYLTYLDQGKGNHAKNDHGKPNNDVLTFASCYDLEYLGITTDYYYNFLDSSMCRYPDGYKPKSTFQ